LVLTETAYRDAVGSDLLQLTVNYAAWVLLPAIQTCVRLLQNKFAMIVGLDLDLLGVLCNLVGRFEPID
jgi:hypothetical protein